MQYHWLNNTNSNKIILFFGGWGTDPNPFKHLQAEGYDVLMFYDYRTLELPLELETIISGKEEVIVIGWSLGVWVAHTVCQPLKNSISKAIAINGTLDPISDKRGIPVAVFNGTLNSLSDANLSRFNRRMLGSKIAWINYNDNSPKRDWQELKQELAKLKSNIKPINNTLYTEAIVGKNDLIFSEENQLQFWNNTIPLKRIEAAHFPFFEFRTWNQVISK